MSKKIVYENFRVVAEPDVRYMYRRNGESVIDHAIRIGKFGKDACETIMAEVRRHVDGYGNLYIDRDTNHVCEHCGAKWTEDSSDYNGGCCAKDIETEPQGAALTRIEDQP